MTAVLAFAGHGMRPDTAGSKCLGSAPGLEGAALMMLTHPESRQSLTVTEHPSQHHESVERCLII